MFAGTPGGGVGQLPANPGRGAGRRLCEPLWGAGFAGRAVVSEPSRRRWIPMPPTARAGG